jgi:signal transduction histidine kinase
MRKLFQNPTLDLASKIALLAFVYAATAVFSLHLSFQNTNASPVWPPSGFALAAMLVCGPRIWPAIFIGAFFANLFTFLENKIAGTTTVTVVSFSIATGNTLEALGGYFILKVSRSFKVLDKARDFGFFLVTALIAAAVSAGIGSSALLAGNIISTQDVKTVLSTWWLGDVSGMIILTPVLLAFRKKPILTKEPAKLLKPVALFVLLLVCLAFVFLGPLSGSAGQMKIYVLFILLIVCVFNMEQWQSSLVVLLVSSFAIWSTLNGRGPFLKSSQNESLLSLQVFLGVAAVMMMFLSTTLLERARAKESLKEINNTLEDKIAERTRETVRQKQELEAANRELIHKTVELERSNKEFQLFAHVASHDLQEPLRTITSYIQLLDSKYKSQLEPDAQELMNFTVDGAKRMQTLIKDLLTYSNVDATGTSFKETKTYDVLQVVQRNLQNHIQKNSAVITYSNDLPVVLADTSQMVQLFQNLIDNAIKYKSFKTPEIHIGAVRKGEEWLFSVTDNGIGVEEKYGEKIFTIFQRLHSRDQYEGTGVGLAICKKIIDRHGGKIWVESAAGSGSVFYFTLFAGPVIL